MHAHEVCYLAGRTLLRCPQRPRANSDALLAVAGHSLPSDRLAHHDLPRPLIRFQCNAGVGFAFGFTLDYTRPTPPPTNSTATPHIMNVTMSNSYVEDTGIGFEFEGLSDSIITGVLVQNVTLGKNVDPSTQCDYINGTCVDQADGTCPKCFTG